ncbi:hypothetical protein DIPPA_31250 [Diplonema papillatum]|nr:hypothetical protein DIPPA_31250 [Diplonema papillatum]
MGQSCLKGCVNSCDSCRKGYRNGCCGFGGRAGAASHKMYNLTAANKQDRRGAMRDFGKLIEHTRYRRLEANAAQLPASPWECLEELCRDLTTKETVDRLEQVFLLYDRSKTGVLSRYETKAFFDDYFTEVFTQSADLYAAVIVHERHAEIALSVGAGQEVTPEEYGNRVKKAHAACRDIVLHGMSSAHRMYHNEGYSMRSEWIQFVDVAGDQQLHRSELLDVFLGAKAHEFERLSMSLLKMDRYFERGRIAADRILFGPRRIKDVDTQDSPLSDTEVANMFDCAKAPTCKLTLGGKNHATAPY